MIGKWLNKIRKEESEPTKQKTEIPWIESSENPWGVPVLDVRPITHHVLSTSKDPQCATNATSYGQDDGSSFIGQKPASEHRIETNLLYTKDRLLANGPLYIPREMEHKWAIFFHNGNIICVRSWLRQVHALAKVDQSGENIVVSSIRGGISGAVHEATAETFDYLLKSHALGIPFPVPISAEMATDPYTAAMWCFSVFGNMAMFATPHKIVAALPKVPLRSHSLLHISVARGDRAEIDCQLENGIPIDLLAADGLSPLHWALGQNDISILKYLIDRGSPVDIRSDQGATPLMTASQGDDIKKVIFLLDHGADPNAIDARGFTAIHRTAEMGKVEMTKLLLDRGANSDIEAEGHTPLSLATQRGEKDIIQLLQG